MREAWGKEGAQTIDGVDGYTKYAEEKGLWYWYVSQSSHYAVAEGA